MPGRRRRQRVEQARGLHLVATPQRLDHALHVTPAFAGVLDQIEVLVVPNLLDPDEHSAAPCRSSHKAPRNTRFGQANPRSKSHDLAPQRGSSLQKPSIYGLFAPSKPRKCGSWAWDQEYDVPAIYDAISANRSPVS